MKRAILSGTLLIAASILSNCSRKTTQAAPGVPEVLVTTVLSQAVPLVSERVATLDGLVNATISARVSGYIVSRNNEEGSAVKSGDLLFQIVLRPYEAALAQAKANLAKARATQLRAEQDEKRALELV